MDSIVRWLLAALLVHGLIHFLGAAKGFGWASPPQLGEPISAGMGSADIHGRIGSAPDSAWMSFTGRQLNTHGENPQRMFLMHARRSGLPVEVLHVFHDATATMQVKVLSSFTIVDAKGPEMDRAETVTVFQELVALTPGAILDAPVRWTAVDEHRVHGV